MRRQDKPIPIKPEKKPFRDELDDSNDYGGAQVKLPRKKVKPEKDTNVSSEEFSTPL